jgi:hypothetical protein
MEDVRLELTEEALRGIAYGDRPQDRARGLRSVGGALLD